MTGINDHLSPSLLEPESRGGDIAEGGLSFQEQVMLFHIPLWLAQEGFTAITRESMGDIEAKFFVPGRGFVVELIEAKDHLLTPSEFWNEVKRFQELDDGSPGTYHWFTLASAGLSRDLAPLANSLRRVRDPYEFYENGSAIQKNSFESYTQIVSNFGHTEQEARFLFEKVLIESDLSTARSQGEALFRQSLIDHLPEYQDLPSRMLGDIYPTLGTFVRKRRNQPITRIELETKLQEKICPDQIPSPRPVLIYTSIQNENNYRSPGIHLRWASFFGGEEIRSFPSPDRWNQQLLSELREVRDWIIQHRSTRRIKLTGNRRLSASLAIGSIFSAVAGFSIEMDYRGESWATDSYPASDTPTYPLVCDVVKGAGEEHLVVSVSIARNIVSEVESCLEQHRLAGVPRLHIKGEMAIISPQQANIVTRAIKEAISDAVSRTKSKQVHLFLAGPSFQAIFLGHRLNAIAPIQCYEWVSSGSYVPTCQLF